MATDHSRSWPAEHAGGFAQGTMLQVEAHSCVVQRFLSAGGHANIYLVTLMSDGTTRVLKHIQFADDDDFSRHSAQVNHEITVMRQLGGHPQIVGLEAAEVTAQGAYILMEHCPSDVLTLMNQTLPRHLDEQTILHIFTDTCKAVAHMHYQQRPLLHRDLKVENILIGSDGYKLCDFGSATSNTIAPNARLSREEIVRMEEEIQAMTTLEYRAPEMIDLYLRRGVTEKADIWALGVLLYKLCYFRTPFDNASPLTILNAEYSIPDKPAYSKQLRHVFQMTLREEPRERSTIYTLCTYLCGLRGEVCLLENRYASPPASPSDSLASSKGGLGYVSAQPPAPPPRRYAASSTKYPGNAASSDAYASDSISELDSGSIVPMRRGRPARQPAHVTTASSSVSPSNSRAASPVPRKHLGFSSRFSSSLSQSSRSVSETIPQSPPASATRENNALGIFDSAGGIKSNVIDEYVSAADPVPVTSEPPLSSSSPRDMRRMRMSVKAPDGRESLSVDFVQGAVFGSARRTSVLRRNPSIASNVSGSGRRAAARNDFGGSTDGTDDTLSSPAVGLSRKSTTSSTSYVSRTVSMGEYADELSMDSGLPGFVCQPLPPPPPSSSSQQQQHQLETPQSAPVRSFAEPGHRMLGNDVSAKPDPMLLANLISPLSLGHSSPTESEPTGHASIGDNGGAGYSGQSDDPWSVPRTTDESALLRLSTILESCQSDSRPALGDAADGRSATSKGLYEVTLDKLEDDARYSMVFDDQLMFNAKAQYAAQRSSVYQSPQNYFDKKSMAEEAHKQWEGIAPETMDDLMSKIDAFNAGAGAGAGASQENNGRPAMDAGQDAWSIAAVVPRPTTAARPRGEEPPSVDLDTVLRRAEQRNRRKLIAQNNRRSQYIFGASNGSANGLPKVLQEDVEDGMRVLSEQEIEELLQKMDMYNRELLCEQEKWGALSGANRGAASIDESGAGGVDLQSIEGMIERANDQLLRSEQKHSSSSGTGPAEPKDLDARGGGKATAVGILQNVISAAKSTFAKSTDSAAVSNAGAAAESDARAEEKQQPAQNACAAPAKPPRTFADQAATVATADVASEPASDGENGNRYKAQTSVGGGFRDARSGAGDGKSSSVSQSAGAASASVSASAAADGDDDKPSAGKGGSREASESPAKEETVVKTEASLKAETASADTDRNKASSEAASAAITAAATADTTTSTTSTTVGARPTTAPVKNTTALNADAANLAVPKLPAMGRTQTDTPASSSAASDPLAEARMRLKKKQSTPLMRTATASMLSPGESSPVSSARAAFLGTLENKSSLPSSPKMPGGPAKKPAKSVKNLVAMFEKS